MDKRAVVLEWAGVAVLLLGFALATAGVITMTFDRTVAFSLIGAGAFVALVGGIWWTVTVKVATRRRRADA